MRNNVGGNRIFNCRRSALVFLHAPWILEKWKNAAEKIGRDLSLMKFQKFVLIVADKTDGRMF